MRSCVSCVQQVHEVRALGRPDRALLLLAGLDVRQRLVLLPVGGLRRGRPLHLRAAHPAHRLRTQNERQRRRAVGPGDQQHRSPPPPRALCPCKSSLWRAGEARLQPMLLLLFAPCGRNRFATDSWTHGQPCCCSSLLQAEGNSKCGWAAVLLIVTFGLYAVALAGAAFMFAEFSDLDGAKT